MSISRRLLATLAIAATALAVAPAAASAAAAAPPVVWAFGATPTGTTLPTEIAIESFSWGVSNTVSTSSTGGATVGKPKFNDVEVERNADKASPFLMSSVTTGKPIPVLNLRSYMHAPGDAPPVLSFTYKLENVLITSVQHATTGEYGPPREHVEMVAMKVTVVGYSYSNVGQLLKRYIFGWDLATNKGSYSETA